MRLIDKDALLKLAQTDGAYDYVSAQEIADAAEIDAVPVVRCKDCKYYNTTGCSDGLGWCEYMGLGVSDDFYCAVGERVDAKPRHPVQNVRTL